MASAVAHFPRGHAQAPLTQILSWPASQTAQEAPQLAESLVLSTHLPPQFVKEVFEKHHFVFLPRCFGGFHRCNHRHALAIRR